MSKPPPTPKRFDPAILNSMTEPLSIRVERRTGGTSSPIPLPPEEDQVAGGIGYSKERILTIEQWLINEWCGGGTLFFILSDSSEPPLKMEWIATYDPRTYPPRIPPLMAPGPVAPPLPMTAAPPLPPPQPVFAQPQPQQVPMSSTPWPSTIAFTGAPPQQPLPSAPPTYFYPQPSQSRGYDPERDRLERERTDLANRLAQAEKEKLEASHKADLERIQRDSDRKLDELKASLQPKSDPSIDARFSKLESVLERLADRITAPAATGPSPELLALQESNRQLQARLDRETERAEQDRREAALREQIRLSNEANNAKLEAVLNEIRSRPTGPDPLMSLVQDMNRQHLDAIKEIARSGKETVDQMRSMMMTPDAVLRLAKDSSGGLDEMRRSLTSTYTDIFGMQREVMQTMLQMQPAGESPTQRLVENGLAKVGELADRYMAGKTKEVLATQQTQRAVIDAQVKLATQAPPIAQQPMHVNADLAAQAASEAASVATGTSQAAPPPMGAEPSTMPQAASGGGLSGAGTPAQPMPSNVIPITQGQSTPPRRTDADWFGPALAQVNLLRNKVNEFLTAIQQGAEGIDPETQRPYGFDPIESAERIIQAAGVVATQQMAVPAFTSLLMQERFADFIDVLLPAPIPQAYRDDVTQILFQMFKKAAEAEDDDEDDDEDDEKNDKADDGTGTNDQN